MYSQQVIAVPPLDNVRVEIIFAWVGGMWHESKAGEGARAGAILFWRSADAVCDGVAVVSFGGGDVAGGVAQSHVG